MPSAEQHDPTPDTAPAAKRITLDDLAAGRATINQYRRQEGIIGPPPYCTAQPATGAHLGAACDACGHAQVLHIGVPHCPVCELVHLNAAARGITPPGGPQSLAAQAWAEVQARHRTQPPTSVR